MTGEKVDFDTAAQHAAGNGSPDPQTDEKGRKNERSTVAFPYIDLDTAVEVSKAIYERSGRSECELDELAAEMGQVLGGGAFRLKTAGASTYGLAEKVGRSAIKLTELGLQIVNPASEKSARADAFLAVPLYEAIYSAYKGNMLPPTKALEREIAKLGVASKQSDKARQVFERAARQAGFHEAGDDRLVKPKLSGVVAHDTPDLDSPPPPLPPDGNNANRNGGGGGGYSDLHPFIQGLLKELPREGAFEFSDRVKWLNLAATAFDMIFESNDKGEIAISFKSAKKPLSEAERSGLYHDE